MTMHSLVPTHFVGILTFHYLSNNYELMVVHDKPQGQQSHDWAYSGGHGNVCTKFHGNPHNNGLIGQPTS